jgi:hypothetical protein
MQEPQQYIEVPKVDGKTAATQMASLRDVTVPPPVSWRPQTAGWYVVGALLLAGLAWIAWRQVRRWQANRYRREALAALQALESALADSTRRPQALRALAEIVKRTQLSEMDRQAVASLSGATWLDALDRSWPHHGFSTPAVRRLGELSSATDETLARMPAADVTALVVTVRAWMGAPHAGVR